MLEKCESLLPFLIENNIGVQAEMIKKSISLYLKKKKVIGV